jgi:hypothetical protein
VIELAGFALEVDGLHKYERLLVGCRHRTSQANQKR